MRQLHRTQPDTSYEWQVRQKIIAEMRNEVASFGLLEAGDLPVDLRDPEASETSDDNLDY